MRPDKKHNEIQEAVEKLETDRHIVEDFLLVGDLF